MNLDKATTWSIVHAERARLVADLRGASAETWVAPSLCPGWTVHDVLAHVLSTAKTSRLGFGRRMVAARFDFDRQNAIGIADEKRDDPHETLELLGAATTLTLTPPAPRATRLVEAIVHGEDIRRPLGIAADHSLDAVAVALAHQARIAAAMGGGRERVAGLRLLATDAPVELGSGVEVWGRAIDLLLATSGRRVAADAFTGPGAARLTGAG